MCITLKQYIINFEIEIYDGTYWLIVMQMLTF